MEKQTENITTENGAPSDSNANKNNPEFRVATESERAKGLAEQVEAETKDEVTNRTGRYR